MIFTLSSIPGLATDLGVWDTILRKAAHATEYAILALLLYRALGREVPAFAIGFAYAVSDEIHQEFVRGRHASPFDVSMDAAGLALGLLLLHATRLRATSRSVELSGVTDRKTFDDRQLDAILERLDALRNELKTMNRRLDHNEGFLALAHEVRSLNESLQALAYAALGAQGPQVRRRSTG